MDLEEELIMEASEFFKEFLQNVIDFERNSGIRNRAKKALQRFSKEE